MQFLEHLPAFLNRQVPGNGCFIGRYSSMGPRAIAVKMAKILGDDAFTACFVESRLVESPTHTRTILKSIDDERAQIRSDDRYKRDTNTCRQDVNKYFIIVFFHQCESVATF